MALEHMGGLFRDLILVALFAALALGGPERGPLSYVLLSTLAGFQVAERRTAALQTTRGSVLANLLKLTLGYVLIGFTGGVTSSYFLVLLVPVVSAAATLGVGATVAFTVLACGSYLSFLLLLDPTWEIAPDQAAELALRVTFLALVGYLTQVLAEAHRTEARKAREAAEQLAEANRSLQEAEAAVRRTERLAALGQLSAGLAHELRNPLGTIRASAEMLTASVPKENGVAAELVGFISAEVDRINTLVTRFLDFARPFQLRPAEAELSEVIDRAIAQLERAAPPYQVAIYKNYSPDVRRFSFDPDLLERALYNLLLNAAQATPPGGAVTVKTRPVDSTVEISVIDRGAGIALEDRESIFNPFFTTKADGVGLGLAIVSKIVDLHGGTMALESEPGKGSVFHVYLPTERRA